ncbi:MAG TPA: DUF4143 domain-containing protein, partial [Chlamydiales bacterium]|nr:DUF4143 domain-containing protein [Chlamydiales bacterium]
YNTALMTAQLGKTFQQVREDHRLWGRIVESAVGAYLLNSIRGTQIELFYWREGDQEVDFVLRHGKALTAIEVKSNHDSLKSSGMDLFVSKFNPSRVLLVGEQGIPLEVFLTTPVKQLIAD